MSLLTLYAGLWRGMRGDAAKFRVWVAFSSAKGHAN